MKHGFLLLLALCLLLAVPVAAYQWTFQDPSEFGAYVTCTGTGIYSCSYIQSGTGGNSYVRAGAQMGGGGVARQGYITNTDPIPTTYAAATYLSYSGFTSPSIRLYDSGGGVLYTYVGSAGNYGRYEVKVIGGVALIYYNGRLVGSSGVLAQNPSYIGFGCQNANSSGMSNFYWDDFVYGASENRYIFGSPEQGFFIKKDMLNPAASGFCFPNGTIISNYNMTTTWGIGETNASQTVILKEWAAPNNAWTYTTTAGTMAGSIEWPLQEAIFNNPNAPYGYYITTIAGSGQVSTVIPYWAYGASIAFDSDTYSQEDTATITWSVDAGGYWDTTTYDYRIDVVEFLTGDVIDTYTVTSQSGSTGTTFTTSDDVGVYYAVLIATPKAGGSELQLNGDTCELTAYLVIHGYVNDAETTARIPVSKIKFYSNGLADYINTVDGNYTTTESFLSGSQMIINVTSTGYRPYAKNFTPVSGAGIYLNFSLIPTNPSVFGIAAGGVIREGDGTGSSSSIPPKPVPNATVNIYNRTYGESYTVETNMAGYYIADQRVPITLTNHRLYYVIPSKAGYRNFTIYSAVVHGS